MLVSDFRYVVRSLFRSKGFAIVSVLTLALGIGASAAIFSVVGSILFGSNPFPADVVFFGTKNKDRGTVSVLLDMHLRAYEEQTDAFSEWGRAAPLYGNIALDGQPVASYALGVTANLLSMLDISPALGRGFLPGEDSEGRNDVAIIAHSFWQRHFNGSPGVLGRKLEVKGTMCTIVGVLPAEKKLPPVLYSEILQPLAVRVDPARPWDPMFIGLGRLAEGVSLRQANAAVSAVHVDLPANMVQRFADEVPIVSTTAELMKMRRSTIHWVLLGAVGFLYGIACLNSSNLVLVRMLGRKRELSIRLALGGGHWRLVRLYLIESLLLGMAASMVGLIVAKWLFPVFLAFASGSSGGGTSLWSLNWQAIRVLVCLTVFTSLIVAIIPAVSIFRTDALNGLKEGGGALGESPRLARVRGFFVILQAAFAVVLLTGAGLMVRSFQNLRDVDLGFDFNGRAKMSIGFPNAHLSGHEERLGAFRQLRERFLRVPGVADAAYGSDALLPGFYYASNSMALPDGNDVKVKVDNISPEYAETAGLRLKRGRWLDQSPGNEVMVNETFARAYWGDEDPVGQLLQPTDHESTGWLVVGVVGDVRERLRDGPGYHIYAKEVWFPHGMNSFVFRLNVEFNAELGALIRRAVYEFDPKIVPGQVMSIDQTREMYTGYERFTTSILKVLSGIALVLTVVGLFTVLTHTVDQRRGEFGLRIALGATKRDLVALVIRRGLLLTLTGIAIGVAGVLALSRYMQSILYETQPHDPLVLVGVALLLIFAATLACVFPSVRATRCNVAHLLRAE